MKNASFNYGKVMASGAVLAITILTVVGSALLGGTTVAQGPTTPIDLTKKIKDKKFADGRRVVIDTLPSGDKIAAEIKGGDFKNWFLILTDGTEVKGEVKKLRREKETTTVTAVCQSTMVMTLTRADGSKYTTAGVFEIPCPKNLDPGAQVPPNNSNSNKPN